MGDGIYAYWSRVDDLFKVNGQLVEPAQVEWALLRFETRDDYVDVAELGLCRGDRRGETAGAFDR